MIRPGKKSVLIGNTKYNQGTSFSGWKKIAKYFGKETVFTVEYTGSSVTFTITSPTNVQYTESSGQTDPDLKLIKVPLNNEVITIITFSSLYTK